MAARVTDAEVKEVIETDLADLTAFITAANLTVNQHLTGLGLSTDLFKEIERWLAAHFVAMRERQVQSEGLLESNVTYGGKYGMGLEFSQYGQQVMLLDHTGRLANASKNKWPIKMEVL